MKSRSYKNQLAKNYLEKHGLYPHVIELNKKLETTGCSLVDYAYLHYFVKQTRPQFFLECGTGISTHVIAKAMNDYCYDFYGGDIKLVSMEHQQEWYDNAVEALPGEYEQIVDIRLAKSIAFNIAYITGHGYETVPKYPYDAVFVDGPEGEYCCIDYLRLLFGSKKPISAIIDGRLQTVLAFHSLLGNRVVRWGDFHIVKPTSILDIMTFVSDIGTIVPHFQKRIQEVIGIPVTSGVVWNA